MSYVRGSLCYELINGLILSFVVSLIVSVGVKMTGDGDFLLIDSWTLIIWWSYIEFEFYCKYIICSMLFVWTTQISFTDCLKHLQIIISNSLWKGLIPDIRTMVKAYGKISIWFPLYLKNSAEFSFVTDTWDELLSPRATKCVQT